MEENEIKHFCVHVIPSSEKGWLLFKRNVLCSYSLLSEDLILYSNASLYFLKICNNSEDDRRSVTHNV